MASTTHELSPLLLVGAPLALAVLEVFHPQARDLLAIDVRAWLVVHYAQIALFPLAALAVAGLVHGRAGLAPGIARVALFVFGVTYVAFDTAAGVGTGILVGAARTSATPGAWRPAIEAVWAHPVMGGSPSMPSPPVLAVLASVALCVGAIAVAVARKREGSGSGPVVLLAASSFLISVFRTHAWPGGPLTFGGISAATLWERARRGEPRAASRVATV